MDGGMEFVRSARLRIVPRICFAANYHRSLKCARARAEKERDEERTADSNFVGCAIRFSSLVVRNASRESIKTTHRSGFDPRDRLFEVASSRYAPPFPPHQIPSTYLRGRLSGIMVIKSGIFAWGLYRATELFSPAGGDIFHRLLRHPPSLTPAFLASVSPSEVPHERMFIQEYHV